MREDGKTKADAKTKLPPSKLIEVSNEVVTTKLSDLIERYLQRAPSSGTDMPVEVHRKIIQQLLASVGDKQVRRNVTEELAVWQPSQLRL